ncbi:hypothetical protein BGW38_005267 [Lunasporangiospora selenospora]|uniref:mRNA stability protein n=1 Tax=Lunasporangiospora selenospora TaxID=979761 RepID=A0A9P6G0C5_9FUNG|nr:hypothetical protein BGW38_005267 [Lunasporangiospora selenospora]
MQSQQDQHLGDSNNGSDVIMAEQEAKLQHKYGNLPIFSKSLLGGHQRKYFDSGDYALNQAGKQVTVGSGHPQPQDIPHSIPVDPVYGSIPARRGSLANIVLQPNNGAEQHAL